MRLLDVGMSTVEGEMATLSSLTLVIYDPFSPKNNFQHHFTLHSLQPRLSAPLLLWTLRNSTTTFAQLYPLTPFPPRTSRLLLTPNGLLTQAVYFVIMIGFSYRTLQTSDLKSYRTNMITFLQDTSGRTKLSKCSMFGLTFVPLSRNLAVLVPLASGPNPHSTSLTDF